MKRRAEIRGETWTLRDARRDMREYGDCSYATKTIRIRRGQDEQSELDTTIHEVLHALLPDFCEESVREGAADLAAILWDMGWRRRNRGFPRSL
ncbi:MAG: hypothetical protein ACREIV_03300 [Planctomycetaceae bacterium]